MFVGQLNFSFFHTNFVPLPTGKRYERKGERNDHKITK